MLKGCWSVISGFIVIVVLLWTFKDCGESQPPTGEQPKQTQEEAFSKFPPATEPSSPKAETEPSPAEHLEKAKLLYEQACGKTPKPGDKSYLELLYDGEQHVKAIKKGAPEYTSAQTLLRKINQRRKELAIKIRVDMANTLEMTYLSKGMDVRVSVSGPDKTTMKLTYVLFSRPLIYKLTVEDKFLEPLEILGFKKVIFYDGYNYSWSYNLGAK